MKKKILMLISALALLVTLASCASNENTKTESSNVPAKQKEETAKEPKEGLQLNVFAAASLEEAFQEIIPLYKEKEGVDIQINLESSGTLQKQIEQGADCDLFVSAGKKQMDALDEKNLVVKDTNTDLLFNDLVLVVPKGGDSNVKSYQDLEKANGKIAIAETETVPVGQYTKASLEKLGIFDEIQDNVVYAKNVKATLTYVENREAACGFVYLSDAVTSDKVEVVETMPEDSHNPIVYPAAVMENSTKKEPAQKFLEFLKTDDCKAIFEKSGFRVK